METPIVLVVIIAARWIVQGLGVPSMPSVRLAMGCIALVLMLEWRNLALCFGFGLCRSESISPPETRSLDRAAACAELSRGFQRHKRCCLFCCQLSDERQHAGCQYGLSLGSLTEFDEYCEIMVGVPGEDVEPFSHPSFRFTSARENQDLDPLSPHHHRESQFLRRG